MPRDNDRVEGCTQDVMIEKSCLLTERRLGIGTLRLRDLHLAFSDSQIGGSHIDIALCLFSCLRRDRAAFGQCLLAAIRGFALRQYDAGRHHIRLGLAQRGAGGFHSGLCTHDSRFLFGGVQPRRCGK